MYQSLNVGAAIRVTTTIDLGLFDFMVLSS